MLLANIPTLVPVPFASGAGSAYVNTIPVASQVGVGDGSAASMTTGFPPNTFLPEGTGGIPPHGGDFNGILLIGSTIDQWAQAGGGYPYNASFCAMIGGYPLGAILQRSDATGDWINIVDGNTSNPDTGGAGWLPYGGSTAIYSQGLSSSDVTLTALEAASPILVLTGTLTANVRVILPTWVSAQWTISNQCTGGYTVTVTTTGGSGVVVAGTVSVYCSSTGIVTEAASAGTVTSVGVTTVNGVSAANVGTTNAPLFAFALGNITPTSVNASGSITAGTSFNISDERAKHDIHALAVRVNLASLLAPHYCGWARNYDDGHGQGVTAQFLQQIAPEYVLTPQDPDAMLAVDMPGLAFECALAANAQAIKAQQDCAALRQQVDDLIKRLAIP